MGAQAQVSGTAAEGLQMARMLQAQQMMQMAGAAQGAAMHPGASPAMMSMGTQAAAAMPAAAPSAPWSAGGYSFFQMELLRSRTQAELDAVGLQIKQAGAEKRLSESELTLLRKQ